MNVFDLFESPQLGAPSNGIGAQSAADQHSASPIGSGTTKREAKKKPVTMMGVAVKEDVDEGWFGSSSPTGEKWYLKKDGAVLRTVNGEPFTFKDRESALAWAKKTYKVSFDQQRILPTTNPDKNLIREPRAQMEAGKPIKPNFKMPPESLQDKMYRQHQELRKKRGAPSPEEYKQRIAQKQAEIDALKEGILDRAAPKLPKPRNPADQVLRGKVNAAGKHLDKKRRQELAPKHKNKDPLAEGEVLQFPKSPEDKNVRARLEQRLLAAFNQIVDYAEDNGIDILEKNAPLYSKLFDKYDTEDATLDPEQAIARNEPIEVVSQVVKEVEHIAKHIDEYLENMWGDTFNESGVDEGWKSALAGAALAGSMALGGGMAHAAEPVVGVGQSQDMQMAVDLAKHNAKLKYLKSVHGDNFQDKQMPEYHFGKLDLKANGKGGYMASVPLIVDNEVQEGWKGKLAGAALAGAAALGGGHADAQQIDLPGPQASYIVHVDAEANGREVHKTVNLGSQYRSEEEAYNDVENALQAKGITRYNIRIEQTYNPGVISSDQPRGGTATGRDYGNPGLGDMISGRISQEIRAGIPDRGGYATGGSTKGQRPRDGSQWWRDQIPPLMREEALEEDIERHLYLMSRAGYDIVQEEWSDKYKRSINCSNPKGFSQKAHCAGKKKNESVVEDSDNLNYIGNCTDDDVIEHIFGDATGFAQAVEEYGDEFTVDDLVVKYDPETDVHSFYYKKQGVAEEKVRLDPKCWSGKKIGNPKTKMKGGVRVNNCVPK